MDETQTQKCQTFIVWLERERKSAVNVHLNTLTKKLHDHHSSSSREQNKLSPSGGSTEQGLYSGTMLTQHQDSKKHEETPAADAITSFAGRPTWRRRNLQDRNRGRIAVDTMEAANESTAKRVTNLTAKKLDSCPVCKSQHYFTKQWERWFPPQPQPRCYQLT